MKIESSHRSGIFRGQVTVVVDGSEPQTVFGNYIIVTTSDNKSDANPVFVDIAIPLETKKLLEKVSRQIGEDIPISYVIHALAMAFNAEDYRARIGK